ncbi:hypothetical protein CYMTET_11663, partial [Cymbomonas tetramitiformis]
VLEVLLEAGGRPNTASKGLEGCRALAAGGPRRPKPCRCIRWAALAPLCPPPALAMSTPRPRAYGGECRALQGGVGSTK